MLRLTRPATGCARRRRRASQRSRTRTHARATRLQWRRRGASRARPVAVHVDVAQELVSGCSGGERMQASGLAREGTDVAVCQPVSGVSKAYVTHHA